MSFEIIATPRFKRDIKKLSKKYISLRDEYSLLIKALEDDPEQGIPLGNNCFKIRISIASKGKRKSGGARVISHIFVQKETVFLLTIYDKSEKENVTNKELAEMLSQLD